MLKNTDKYKSEIGYEAQRYKKPKKAQNKDVTIFVSVFLAGVLIILGFAKILSPNVDVKINSDDETAVEYTENDMVSNVDERLRHIKLEDSGVKEDEEDMFSPELDERVVLPKQKNKTVGEFEAEMATNKHEETAKTQQNETSSGVQTVPAKTETPKAVTEKKPETAVPSSVAQNVNAKVVVGYYATEKQAEVAKSIINDAGLSVTPIVKNLGGYYTLQVGSYNSREKAQQEANNLLKNNFPARVIVD